MTRLLVLFLLICLLLSACLPRSFSPYQPWLYTDLRGMDPADALSPSNDLVALYTRSQGDELQIRLDWLDQNWQPDYDLYLILDTTIGGTRQLPLQASAEILWDSLLYIPANGAIRGVDAQNQLLKDLSLVFVRDPVMDIVTISLNRRALPGVIEGDWPGFVFQFQIFITLPGDLVPVDTSSAFRSNQQPPSRAKVLLAFWNSYPAYTPALALRRWDGAHTGPTGGRHGLYNLLRTALATHTPIALLDLKTPAALSALDYVGGLEMVKEMASSGLLLLPDYLSDASAAAGSLKDWVANKELSTNQFISHDFGVASSRMIFAALDGLPNHSQYSLTFARVSAQEAPPLGALIRPVAWQEKCALALPYYSAEPQQQQISLEGPTVDVRRALVEAALDHASSIIILGGDLPTSAWGNPEMARAAFRYLANHPWIQPLNSQDLIFDKSFQCNEDSPAISSYPKSPYTAVFNPTEVESYLQALQDAPTNQLSEQAWRAYLALFNPISPSSLELPALRTNYLPLAWPLLYASRWAEAPSQQLGCKTIQSRADLSWCFLANNHMFLAFESASGMLTHAVIRLDNRSGQPTTHLIIAPPAQYIVGLSPPNTWELSAGLSADPGAIPAAFFEPGGQYQPTLGQKSLAFVSSDAAVRKEFTLSENELLVNYTFSADVGFHQLRIPLAFDPWKRFSPGWVDLYPPPEQHDSGLCWQIEPGIDLCLEAPLSSLDAFSDTLAMLVQPENPNMDYPAGHFLPFPFNLIRINPTQTSFQIRIFISQTH
ncbi:MAG: hypothetical protein JXB15_04385 [Anaerolineales bacterium]|nr:hypothetical protein [Anaerolineales bacterium]